VDSSAVTLILSDIAHNSFDSNRHWLSKMTKRIRAARSYAQA